MVFFKKKKTKVEVEEDVKEEEEVTKEDEKKIKEKKEKKERKDKEEKTDKDKGGKEKESEKEKEKEKEKKKKKSAEKKGKAKVEADDDDAILKESEEVVVGEDGSKQVLPDRNELNIQFAETVLREKVTGVELANMLGWGQAAKYTYILAHPVNEDMAKKEDIREREEALLQGSAKVQFLSAESDRFDRMLSFTK